MSGQTAKLIVGLGNVGREYTDTRHNIGFYCLDRIVAAYRLGWHEKSRFRAFIAEREIEGQKIIFAKPTTYYNLSGEAVSALMMFYKLTASNVLVIHDELDLLFGTIRTRIGGSNAGNNGVKSISGHIGNSYARIRLGIANEQRATRDAADFVLDRFLPNEQQVLPTIAEHVLRFVEQFVREDQEFLHTSLQIL